MLGVGRLRLLFVKTSPLLLVFMYTTRYIKFEAALWASDGAGVTPEVRNYNAGLRYAGGDGCD